MTETILHRELLKECSTAAVLTRTGQGVEWLRFLEIIQERGFVEELVELEGSTAVVGGADNLNALRRYIDSHARKSYALSEPESVQHVHLAAGGEATSTFIRQMSGPGHYAVLSIAVDPVDRPCTIELRIPCEANIPEELHAVGISHAILHGVVIAAMNQPARPVVGFRVNVTAGRWHVVDSSATSFRRVARDAMLEILEQP